MSYKVALPGDLTIYVLYHFISMNLFSSTDVATDAVMDAGAKLDILDRNWQTTTAIGLGVATGGIGGALLLAAFPAQTIAAGTAIGGLAYAGQRRADGKSALPDMPFLKKDKAEAVAEPAAA